MVIEWRGDLDDDCSAEWSGLLLRAEWMDGDRWWWEVSDLESGEEIDSSNEHIDIEFASGDSARRAAEHVAKKHRRSCFQFAPGWRTENAVALASAIYAERAFDRLPILADALEEAGCDDADVLTHCRGPGPHARGCWVVDLILGKS